MKVLVLMCALFPLLCSAAEKKGSSPVPDLTKGEKPGSEGDWTLGPTGARGWAHNTRGNSAAARQILVKEVAKGSPADGLLQKGDVIVGVDGKAFSSDARVQFAKAITAAEEEAAGGKLSVLRWRAGKTESVELRLRVMGRYSATAPYDCPKSAKIFDMACEVIARRDFKNVSIPNCMNALALLASGKPEHRALLADYAKRVAVFKPDGFLPWHYGYMSIFLAEYVLATGDKSVSDGLRRIALEMAVGQSRVGTWGHGFATPNGGLGGYGAMNQTGLGCTLGLVLAREAGVKERVVDDAIARSVVFLRYYFQKGAPPYGDHKPANHHEANGRCAMSAVLFDLLGDREAAEFFAKMAAAGYDERERGHTGCYFSFVWALLGSARCGPMTSGASFKEHSWYYDLARDWNGGVSYQQQPDGNNDDRYARWDCTGSYLLAFSLSRKSLHLTGKKGFTVAPLNREQTDDVIAAGRDFFPTNGRNGYEARTTGQLLAGVASWSPIVRQRSTAALVLRKDPVTPRLQEMLGGKDREARYGAALALGAMGPSAEAAGAQLRAKLKDQDPWLQSLAAMAVIGLGPEQRKQAVPDLLALAAQQHSADPRHIAQRYAAVALFERKPTAHGPPGLLTGSLDGVNRDLLYPAVRAVLRNDDPTARSAVGDIYRKLTDADLAVLLPDIFRATEELAPTNEMFGDDVRLAGLDLLTRLHIREAMPLCWSILTEDRWGHFKRFPKSLQCLARYGPHAKEYLPQLRELREKKSQARGKHAEEHLKLLDEAIAKISAGGDGPKLVGLGEYGKPDR